MLDWLSKIDPTFLATAITAVGGWLYAKASGQKSKSLTEHLEAVLLQEVHRILLAAIADDALARKRLEAVADTLLSRLGVKKTVVIDALVDRLVDVALAKLRELVWERMKRQLEAIENSAKRVDDMIDGPTDLHLKPL